jgi:hypothetical protein
VALAAAFAAGAQVIGQHSYHVPGDVVDTAVSTTGTEDRVSLDVGRLTTLKTTVTLGRRRPLDMPPAAGTGLGVVWQLAR